MRSAIASCYGARLVAGRRVWPAQQQPPGQIRPRPAEGREPELAAAHHPRVQAALDARRAAAPGAAGEVSGRRHPRPSAGADLGRTSIDTRRRRRWTRINLQVMVNASGASGDRLRAALAAIRASRHKDRFVMFTNIDFRDVGPGFGAKAAAQLEADIKAGALGLGEIMKDFGLTARKTDGIAAEAGRPRARSDLADGGAAEHPGVHSHRRPGGVLPAARLPERALAGDGAVSGPPLLRSIALSVVRGADGRARSTARQAPEDDLRPGAPGLARQRPRPARRR